MLKDIHRIQRFITLYADIKVNLNDPYIILHFLTNRYFYLSFD
jgi:hypothetical protein